MSHTSSAATSVPPIATPEPSTRSFHGTELHDSYAWLRDKGSPRVEEYLRAENAYTASIMAGTESFQQNLYDEILSHIQETDSSVPYRDGAWEYLTRTEQGRQYARYCRRPLRQDGSADELAEVTFLDINQLAEGQPFMAVGTLALSPDGNLLAYSTDNTGFRQYTLRVRDLRTGQDLAVDRQRVGSVVWAADSNTLLFTTEEEETKREDRAFRFTVLPQPSTPIEIFHEPDELYRVHVGRTHDRRLLLLGIESHTTSETHFLPADQPTANWTVLAPRVEDEEYHADHRDGFFYLRSNRGAERFRLLRAPVATPGREHWEELLPELPDQPFEDFTLFHKYLVASYSERGLPVLRAFSLDADGKPVSPREIRFPDPAYDAFPEVNRDFYATTFRYAYQSLVRPSSVFRYDLETGGSTLLKQAEIPGGFDASHYRSERLWFRGHDGTEVPISLVYRPDAFQKGRSPLYVYGYGSYGYALPLGFSSARLPLLDRGLIMAYAHVRGGGELGDPWHDAGKMMQKHNTFTDFIEAVEFLLAEGYGDPARVAIEGGSAGGLLMGAVVNGKPSLFRAVLSHVPFVDVMNTMLDPTLPLTVGEYVEWGNPNEPEAFHYMLSYSPYDQLKPGAYPAMLVKTSLNDSQVMYWEPAKYVAKLRTLKTNPEWPLLFHINMEAGHGGASGRYDYLKEVAFDHVFLLRELGLDI